MKKLVYFLIIIFCIGYTMNAQDCPSRETNELDNQSAIFSFGNRYSDCRVIEGNLHIGQFFPPNLENYSINDLSPLAKVVSDSQRRSNQFLVLE